MAIWQVEHYSKMHRPNFFEVTKFGDRYCSPFLLQIIQIVQIVDYLFISLNLPLKKSFKFPFTATKFEEKNTIYFPVFCLLFNVQWFCLLKIIKLFYPMSLTSFQFPKIRSENCEKTSNSVLHNIFHNIPKSFAYLFLATILRIYSIL